MTGPVRAALAQPCVEPAAPEGMAVYADQITSWVKWGTLTVIGMGTIAAVALLVAGIATQNPRGSRWGYGGLVVCLIAAILYVVGPGIIGGIVEDSC